MGPGHLSVGMARPIQRYLNVRSAYGASLSPSGRLAFLMDTTGTAQIWCLEEPRSWPVQWSYGDEPVSFVDWSPAREELAFGMDRGGNEMTQLYRARDGGDVVERWTDAPETKHMWGGWSPAGDRVAYTANARDRSVFDVHVTARDAAPGESDLVLETDGWYSVADWSPAGDALAVVESHSNYDQDVHLVDLATGTARHVTPHDGEARFGSVNWVDEDRLVLVADDGDDTTDLVALDPSDGTTVVLDDGEGREVTGVNVDRDARRLVYAVNEGGYTRLRAASLEGTELRPLPTPELPEGVAGGSSFGPRAQTVALTVTTRTLNANVLLIDLPTGETRRWTDASTAGIPRSSFVAPELVQYESFDGREIPAFYTVRDDVAAGETDRTSSGTGSQGGVPVVVDVHGGPESQRRPSFSALTQYFVEHGYAVFEPNVRGSAGYGREYASLDDVRRRMDSVEDLRCAADWLADRSEVDEDRLVVKGGSYGGFMVLATLAEHPERWAAGVDTVGIANFVTFLENTGEWRRELREAEYGSLDEDRDFLERISPVNNADAIRAPLMVLHGANDPRVPVEEAEQIASAVEANGVPVETLIFEDEGHGFGKLENRIEAYSAMVDFLDDHV